MKNRDLFFKDPTLQELLNDGVAKVLDSYSPDDLFVLRQELEIQPRYSSGGQGFRVRTRNGGHGRPRGGGIPVLI